jgi:hypothetical protein
MSRLEGYLDDQGLDISDGVSSNRRAHDRHGRQCSQPGSRPFFGGCLGIAGRSRANRRQHAQTVVPGDDAAAAMGVLLRKITGFSGLVHENMYRFSGWRFLTIGRSLERAMAMSELLAAFAEWSGPHGGFELCVEVGDSVMTHRRRYSVTASRDTVIDLLALDPLNPRSIAFHINEIKEQVGLLARRGGQWPIVRSVACGAEFSLICSAHTPQSLDHDGLVTLSQAIGI